MSHPIGTPHTDDEYFLHNIMENAGYSSPGNVISSGCDVCQGLGDTQHPRWFLVEQKPDSSPSLPGRYIYTYIQHASIEALAASADGGCCTCATIGGSFLGIGMPSVFNAETAELMLDGESTERRSKRHAVQLEDQALRASKLAQIAKREGLCTTKDLMNHGYGMIILQFYSDTKSGPWVRNRIAKPHAILLDDTYRECILLYFNTTCMSSPARYS